MEVLLAVFVLSVGIVATLTLITSSLKNSMNARNQIIASQLAQEGVELVINIRDTNVVQGLDAFSSGFPGNDSIFCRIGMDDDPPALTCSNTPEKYNLYYSASNFYILNDIGAATKFQRKIKITYTPPLAISATQATVESIVVWNRPDGDFPAVCNAANSCVSAQTTLTENNN